MNCMIDYSLYAKYLDFLQEAGSGSNETRHDLNVLFMCENKELMTNNNKSQNAENSEGCYVQNFNELLSEQEKIYKKILFEPVFVEDKDISLFTYRIEGLIQSLSPRQIKTLRSVEVKKIVLRSKKMKEYFANHLGEKDVLVNKLNKLSQFLKKHEVRLPKEVPEYLLPSFMKNKVNRRMKAFMEAKTKNEEKMQNEKQEKEDNEITSDPSRLRTFSSHKLWKIRHRKINKKTNKKLIRKGIYTT